MRLRIILFTSLCAALLLTTLTGCGPRPGSPQGAVDSSYNRGAPANNSSYRGGPPSTSPAYRDQSGLPPVVSSRYRNPPSRNRASPRSAAPSSQYAAKDYNQVKMEAKRSAKRRANAKGEGNSTTTTAKAASKKTSAKKSTAKTGAKKKGASKAYKVLSKWYYPLPSAKGYNETGSASWYGKRFHGGPTASGEKFDMNALTAAHKTLPFNSKVKVTNLVTGSNIVVRINDRGPFTEGRLIDVSSAAAELLGFNGKGVVKKVRVEAIE